MRSPTKESLKSPLQQMIDYETRNGLFGFDIFDACIDYAETEGYDHKTAIEAYGAALVLRHAADERAINAEWEVTEIKELMEHTDGTAQAA